MWCVLQNVTIVHYFHSLLCLFALFTASQLTGKFNVVSFAEKRYFLNFQDTQLILMSLLNLAQNTSGSTWVEKAQLPCWYLYNQQVLHQRWIWGSHKWESMQGIYPGFEIQGRRHQKSKSGVSVVPQEGLMSSKNILKKLAQNCSETILFVMSLSGMYNTSTKVTHCLPRRCNVE